MSTLKYRMATGSAIAAFVGIAGLSLPQALAGDLMGTSQASEQQSRPAERAQNEYEIQKQECKTLKNSQPDAYEPCLEKAEATRDNLFTQNQPD